MTTRRVKRRQKSPAQERYDASHPVVSTRLSHELYDRLMAFTAMAELSLADVITAGLESLEPEPDWCDEEEFEDA